MLAIFNNTFLDTRTELEKQLDEFIEKRNKTKRLNRSYSIYPGTIFALSTINENIESIASFCHSVSNFFSGCYLILSNIPTIAKYVCLVLTMVGFTIYALFNIYEGKKVAVISTTIFVLIRLIASCLG